jgi:hypothetical protein
MSCAANRVFYCEDIYCSISAVSHHLSHYFLSTVFPISKFTLSCLSMMAEPKKSVVPKIEYSTVKTSTAVSQLSPIIFLTPFSTVSSLYCLSSLKIRCLMSIHDGRTQKKSCAVIRVFYCDDIYCSVSAVSHHLSHSFLNCLITLLSLLSQNSLSHVYS